MRSLLILHITTLFFFNSLLNADVTQTVFTNIYEKNLWGSAESVSGPGSTLKETEKIRAEIPELFASLNIKKIIDAPCGDFNWLSQVNLSSVKKYIGVDIVEDIIYKNNELYANKKKKFLQKNIITDPLPEADLIMCRDCLVHFPFQEINKTLANFKKTGARYLLTTTFPGCKTNKNIPSVGGWRPLNLELPPFNFPKPLALITEEIKYNNAVYVTKSLALWELKDIPCANVPTFDDAMKCHTRDALVYNKLNQQSHPAQAIFAYFKNQYENHIRLNQDHKITSRIPKIIHQIWIGPKPFPEKCKKWQKSWLALNPDWEYKLWTNDDLKDLTLINQSYYDQETNWGAKSDILRYEILHQFGGLYVDVDFECIQPFDWLHSSCDFYAGLLEIKRLKNTARLANGIIASSPQHPLMEKLIEELPNYRFEKDLLRRVGPDYFTAIVHKYIQSSAGINIVFPANFFFSWSLNSILVQPETMAIHYYAGTWV